uniref:Molybdate-anion transporter n=1 Tax=Clastoptera arizonana TaxID=38151 RepID=A0A1B6E3E2_9HEMI
MMFIATFLILIVTAISMLRKSNKSIISLKNANFQQLQKQYLIVYFIASFADWLQGPYVYKLYSDYGFSERNIAILYIVGFASSSIFGNFVGHLADVYGRKTLSAAYGIIYSFCCLTKLSSDFYILFFGRICGGISTSILCTTFDAWYINEHTNHHKLPIELMNLTFSQASFYSGLLAITAGVVSQISAEHFKLGPVSPFIIAVPFLLTSTLIVLTTWTENSCTKSSTKLKFWSPLKLIFLEKPKLLLIGFIQSFFEATMYTFIFSWTPIIRTLNPPLGLVFACFMVAYMIGSKLYELIISKHIQAEIILTGLTIISFLSLSLVTFLIYVMKIQIEAGYLSTSYETLLTQACFFLFIIYEICLGLYDPAIGFIKGKMVPEENRASVTNWFRVPMNIFTCITLTLNQFYEDDRFNTSLSLKTFTQFSYVYLLCSTFLVISLLMSLALYKGNVIAIEEVKNQATIKSVVEDSKHLSNKDG